MRYYIADDSNPNGFLEVTEEKYNSLFGDVTIRSYVQDLYCENISICDVPYEYRERVQTVVSNKIRRWGEYKISEVGTDEIYEEAIDVEDAPYEYEETNEKIEVEE